MVQPLANLLKPLSSIGSKVRRIISHEFGVVQLSTHLAMSERCGSRRFDALRLVQKHPAHLVSCVKM